MIESFSKRQIIDCLAQEYAIQTTELTFLPLGADKAASVYKAQTQGKHSYFVKLRRGLQPPINARLLTLLHEAGIQQIIPPLKSIHDQHTHRIDGFTLIVYPFIEGQNGFSSPLKDHQWIVLGKTLRQVHDFQVPEPVLNEIRRENYTTKWRTAVKILYEQMQMNTVEDELHQKLINFLKAQKNSILHLVDRAEQLCQRIQKISPQYVLCHSDIHGGNVLLESDNHIYIVDWDDPIMAPKERDLMFIGGGIANIWNNPHEEALFYQGYGKTNIDKTLLAYYRHERIVEDIAIFTNELLKPTSAKDRLEMYQPLFCHFSGVQSKRDPLPHPINGILDAQTEYSRNLGSDQFTE